MRSMVFALSLLTAGSVGFVAQRTTAAPPLNDATIIALFDAANTYDIEASQLALQKSKNADVRALATQFMNDHKAVRQQGRDLAKQLKVTPTPPKANPLAPAHIAAMKALRGKSGAAFDQAYAANEVAFHQQVLDAVSSTLLPAIQNAQLKAFIEKVGPAFQGHLEAAKQLQKKLGTT